MPIVETPHILITERRGKDGVIGIGSRFGPSKGRRGIRPRYGKGKQYTYARVKEDSPSARKNRRGEIHNESRRKDNSDERDSCVSEGGGQTRPLGGVVAHLLGEQKKKMNQSRGKKKKKKISIRICWEKGRM